MNQPTNTDDAISLRFYQYNLSFLKVKLSLNYSSDIQTDIYDIKSYFQ